MSLIYKMLDLSTYHLSIHTIDMLHESTDKRVKSLIYYEKNDPELDDIGFFVHINEDGDNNGLPEDLINCIRFAKSKGCEWIHFDPDGEVEGPLQIYVR